MLPALLLLSSSDDNEDDDDDDDDDDGQPVPPTKYQREGKLSVIAGSILKKMMVCAIAILWQKVSVKSLVKIFKSIMLKFSMILHFVWF
jgi:hypothetical protein